MSHCIQESPPRQIQDDGSWTSEVHLRNRDRTRPIKSNPTYPSTASCEEAARNLRTIELQWPLDSTTHVEQAQKTRRTFGNVIEFGKGPGSEWAMEISVNSWTSDVAHAMHKARSRIYCLHANKFNAAPTTEHLAAATYTLRYLRNTAGSAIHYN
jgi:hypothetical protein